jgi:sugar lactone lactonase YvrE
MTNKLTFLLVPVLALYLGGCTKDSATDVLPEESKAAARVQDEITTINFTSPNLFPEGVAYDPFNQRFYVSSTTRGDIGIVTADGTYTPFITDETLTRTTGLELDEARKRLLVSHAPNGIGAYDSNTGERIFYTNLTALLPGAPIFINDITIDPQGNAYVTNSLSPVIYKVDPYGNATIFFQDAAFATGPGQFGFNGIVYDNRGYLLAAFTSTNQVVRIPVRDPETYAIVELNAPLQGPDGLLLSKDGKQLVVVNNAGGSAAGRVLTFTSQDRWESGTLSTTFATGAVFPTTAASDGKNLYVLYAYLHQTAAGRSTFTIQEVPLQDWSPF